MGKQLDQSEIVSVEEAIKMEMIINQALIDILVSKGICTEDEIVYRIKELRGEQEV
jgi:hypothetical protein